VVHAVRALKDYKGITGTYTFNDQGDLTLAKYYVYKVVSVDATKWEQNSIIASYDIAPP
jgi:branched-chain amino acid transport system substrate-binding protein